MRNNTVTMTFLVSGRVQGVGFRWSTRNKARELGLNGWVRNCVDGRVEGEVSGACGAVAQFIEWLKVGPPAAGVDSVNTSRCDASPDHQRFEILS